jgi:hypothetical protein
MKVKEAIELLSKFDPETSIIGQYYDPTLHCWPMGFIEIHELSGMKEVLIQIKNWEAMEKLKEISNQETAEHKRNKNV